MNAPKLLIIFFTVLAVSFSFAKNGNLCSHSKAYFYHYQNNKEAKLVFAPTSTFQNNTSYFSSFFFEGNQSFEFQLTHKKKSLTGFH